MANQRENNGKNTVPPRAIAPGSALRTAPSTAKLTPNVKPIGPSKGGPPPMGTKVGKPTFPKSSVVSGERAGGHAKSRHINITDGALVARLGGTNPDGTRTKNPPTTVTKFVSKADETRASRIIAKSPAVQQAKKELAKAPFGTSRAVTVQVPAGRTPPQLKEARALPKGVSGPVPIVQKPAHSVTTVLKRNERGVGTHTMYGATKPGMK